MTGGPPAGAAASPLVGAGEALLLVLASFLLLHGPGAWLARLGLPGIAASELLFAGGLAALWLRARGPASPLGASGPGGLRRLAGGLLVGASLVELIGLVERGLALVWPVPPPEAEALRRLVSGFGAGPAPSLAALGLALALAPALGEELLFRGAVQGALSPALGLRSGIALASVLFAAYHGSLHRLVPATLAGIALGLVRHRAGALGPAVVAHATNNLVVLILVRHGLEEVPAPTTPLGMALLAAALGALPLGLRLATGPSSQRP